MRLIGSMFGACLLAGCAQPVASDPDATNPPVKPRVVTTALPHDTDDPAIWINRADPAKSLVSRNTFNFVLMKTGKQAKASAWPTDIKSL